MSCKGWCKWGGDGENDEHRKRAQSKILYVLRIEPMTPEWYDWITTMSATVVVI